MCVRRFQLGSCTLGLAFVVAFVPLPATAQETGSIVGTVLGPDQLPLPGVVVLVSGALIPGATTHSQSNGVYRFPSLPPAQDYTLRFQLDGFREVVRDRLIVRVEGTTRIDVSLAAAGVSETITVSGQGPIVDRRRTGNGSNLTERYMQSIPSARDPWVMAEHTAGIQVWAQNVGGSASGQQGVFAANGSKVGDTVWTYDGAEITGPLGESSLYFDFDALEEISITTGGNDPSIATGGVRLNFVTRRGGNQWRGSSRLYFTAGELQALTVGDPESGKLTGNYSEDELFPGYVGNSIDDIEDWGAEVGGPGVRDRLFVWGALGKQNIETFVGTTPDNTRLTNWHAKINAHVGERTVASFTFVSSRKDKDGVGASVRRPQETTQDQRGLSSIYTAKVQHAFDDNNYLEATLNRTVTGFSREPRGGRDIQASLDLSTGVWGGSYTFSATNGVSTNARLDGNSYRPGVSVDHEIRYGYSFRDRDRHAEVGYPQGAIAAYYRGQPVQAWLTSDGVDNYRQRRQSFYLGDTISAGRTTIHAGLRFDHQTSTSLPSAVPASAFRPETFPGASFPGFDSGFAWDSLSPRAGLTYDLTGDGSTMLRLSAARYYSQMFEAEMHSTNTTRQREMDFEWNDANGNGSVDANETGDLVWISPGWDPADPDAPSPNVILPTSAPHTSEVLAGIERGIGSSLAVGGSVIYRRHGNYTWEPRAGEDDPAFWRQATQDVAGYGVLTVYEPVGPRANYTIYQQRAGYGTSYGGVELTVRKRFADRWMANASFDYGQTTAHFDGPGSYTDPTNLRRLDDRPYAYDYGSRFASWGSSSWYLKGSGRYEVSTGLSLAAFFHVRQGYVTPRSVRSNRRANGASQVDVLIEDFGDSRLPTYWNLDLRAEKIVEVARASRLHLILDAFNVTNNDVILGRESRVNSPYYGRATQVLQGRTVRLGLRLVFR